MNDNLIFDVSKDIIRMSGKPKDRITVYNIMDDIKEKIIPIVKWVYGYVRYPVGRDETGKIIWNYVKKKKVSEVIGYRIVGKYGTENYYY